MTWFSIAFQVHYSFWLDKRSDCTGNNTANSAIVSNCRDTEMDLWFWILGGLLSVLAVVGNGVVIVLISTRRRLRTTANWFILSLAVADCSLAAIYVPLLSACEAYSQKDNFVSSACRFQWSRVLHLLPTCVLWLWIATSLSWNLWGTLLSWGRHEFAS